LQRLLESSFVTPVSAPAAEDGAVDDERRRYYALTPEGRRAAATEAKRLAVLVDGAREARLLRRVT
jgi:DNA-binding MarR family transcriptional regulator